MTGAAGGVVDRVAVADASDEARLVPDEVMV